MTGSSDAGEGKKPLDKGPTDSLDGSHGDRGVIRASRSLSLDLRSVMEFQFRSRSWSLLN